MKKTIIKVAVISSCAVLLVAITIGIVGFFSSQDNIKTFFEKCMGV